MMTEIRRNACRVCLGEGAKSIFTPDEGQNDDPTQVQYGRLAEKLRFVGMMPVVDSNHLPNMLCYTCIVQLNMAYNFKNVIISTNMYLDRYVIEKGIMPPCSEKESNPVTSSMLPPAVPAPRVVDSGTIASSSGIGSTYSPVTSVNSHQTIFSDTDSPAPDDSSELSSMIDIVNIKQEVVEEDTQWLPPSSVREAFSQPTTSVPQQSAEKNVSNNTKRSNNPVVREENASTSNRPMVAVHEVIQNNQTQDRRYIDQVLSSFSAPSLVAKRKKGRPKSKGARRKKSLARLALPKQTLGTLAYDLKNSIVIRNILTNMPASRLRGRPSITEPEKVINSPKSRGAQ